MNKRSMILVALVCGALQAQTWGLSLGVSQATPQTIEGVKPERARAFLGAISYRTHGVTFATSYRADSSSDVTDQGEPTGGIYRWGYVGVRASIALPLGFDLGIEGRKERSEARGHDGAKVRETSVRPWARIAWEHEIMGDGCSTAFGVAGAFAKRRAFDESATYGEADALRLLAPSAEITAFVTVRF